MDNGDLSMKVLVTGGAGFLGSSLVDYLAGKGYQVRSLDVKERHKGTEASASGGHKERQIEQNLPEGTEELIGDIRDRRVIQEAVKDIAIVFHLAALVTQSNVSAEDYRKVNVEGTRALLEEAKKAGVKRFIYCSSDSVSGRIREFPAKESDACYPENIYGITKYEAEKVVLRFRNDLEVVIARPTRVYGPRDFRMLQIFKSIKKKRFFLVGKGKVLFHPVYISDFLEGLELCARRENVSGEIFYLGGENPLELKEFLGSIARYLGVKLPAFTLHAGLAKTGAWFLEGACSVLKITPPLTRRNLEFFLRDRSYAISKAKRMLGYKPRVAPAGGIKRTGDWYREEGYL